MTSITVSTAPGTILGGKYRIERVLGEGGMGVVVAALHLHLGQRVALKFLLDHAHGDDQIRERFLREARAASRLRSEHVGRVIDVDTLDTGAPFIVMEYLDGHDLSAELARRGSLPVGEVADYLLQALEAVAEAHALGIIHRDLKPANLFLTHRPDGAPCIKVLDFGIAKATSEVAMNLTQTTTVMGSPGYMSPEQLRSTRDVDARSDIWSLGVILYELSSGQPPFNGQTVTELALKIAIDPTPRLGLLPAGFDAIVYRCLEKDPARRFGDVAELAHALVPYGPPSAAATAAAIARMLDARPGRGPGAQTAPLRAPSTPTTLGLSSASRTAPLPARHRWLGVAAGAIAATAIAGAIVVVAQAGGRTRNAASPAATSAAPPAAPPAATSAVVPIDAGLADAPSTADAARDASRPAARPAAPVAAPAASRNPPAPAVTPPRALPPRRNRPPRSPAPTTPAAAGSADLEDTRY